MDWLNDYEFMGQLVIGIFFSIIFIQSAVDKVFDWKGNSSWLHGHFEKTFLAPIVGLLLGVITVTELLAGLTSLCGVICLILCADSTCIYYGLLLSILSFLMLLTGQRIAKDYEGAKTVAIYFGVALLSLLFF